MTSRQILHHLQLSKAIEAKYTIGIPSRQDELNSCVKWVLLSRVHKRSKKYYLIVVIDYIHPMDVKQRRTNRICTANQCLNFCLKVLFMYLSNCHQFVSKSFQNAYVSSFRNYSVLKSQFSKIIYIVVKCTCSRGFYTKARKWNKI